MKKRRPRLSGRKRLFVLAAAVLFIFAGVYLAMDLIVGDMERADNPEMTYRESDYVFKDLTEIVLGGEVHHLRTGLTSILLMGVDNESEGKPMFYRGAGQADFLRLLVLDHTQKKVWQLPINRNTMTPVTILSEVGKPTGKKVYQICLAFNWGDGGTLSAQHTRDAVSELLLNVPVHFYIGSGMSGIPVLNDACGGVKVTFAEDLTTLDPAFRKGETVLLTGQQARAFVRARKSVGGGTNEERMARQEQYLTSLQSALTDRIRKDKPFIGNLYDKMEKHLITDISRARLINELWSARTYEIMPPVAIDGVNGEDESGVAEFYADHDSILHAVLEIFCVD